MVLLSCLPLPPPNCLLLLLCTLLSALLRALTCGRMVYLGAPFAVWHLTAAMVVVFVVTIVGRRRAHA